MKLRLSSPKLGALVAIAIVSIVVFSSADSASAATNCRKVMRDLQVQVINAKSNPDSSATADEIVKINQIIQEKMVAYQECKPDFQIWYQWNQVLNPSTPFPFGEAGDPRVYTLGPISWWWDKIYLDLFGKNLLLMLLFGWELFLGGLYAALVIPLGILSAVIPSLGKVIVYPFKIVGRRRKRHETQNPPDMPNSQTD
jgi:hypothetical protein